MSDALSPRTLKRLARGPSSDALLMADDLQAAAKRRDTQKGGSAVAPLLAPKPGESLSAFFARLAARLRSCPLLSPATDFNRDGLYLYKRPVRSAAGDKAALLASAGTVFYHVVLYVKQGEELTALEFGPASGMDITDNMLAEAAAAPVVLPAPAVPEPQHLPMLHLAVAHHPLAAARVQQALRFAESTSYHALRNNCIAFADFAVRVLTGGAVRGAPLAFDALVGQVPAVESPLLGLLGLTTGMRWHDVCDGGRTMRHYLERHPDGLPPPVPGAEALELAEESEEGPGDATEAATGALPAPNGAPSAAPAFNPATLAALASLLPPGGLPGLQAALAGLVPASAGASVTQQPAESSGCSEDTTAGVATTGAASASAQAAPPAASVGSSLASTGSSRKPAGGPALPPRRKAPRAAA